MKKFRLVLLLAVMAAGSVFNAAAQNFRDDPRYGNTPEEREENVKFYQFFQNAYNDKQYNEAVGYMQHLLEKAPKVSINLYINGLSIYRNKIARATSKSEQQQYIDSVMMLYDMRIEHFPTHNTVGKTYVNKARDFSAYNPLDHMGAAKLYAEALDFNGESVEPKVALEYFNQIAEAYKADEIEAPAVMDAYTKYLAIAEKDAETKDQYDALLVSSGAADCDNLNALFRAQLAETPDDESLLARAFTFMSRAQCNSDFYFEVAERYYEKNPAADVAMLLAQSFEAKEDYDKAVKYLREAIANETDVVTKANLCVRAAGAELSAKDYPAAASFAREAISVNPGNGYAYMVLAQAYAMGSSACSGFERQSVFWLVVDTLSKAREAFADDAAQLETVNKQISSYVGNFPSKEDAFFLGINDGSSYTVRCGWISGTTTVRTRK